MIKGAKVREVSHLNDKHNIQKIIDTVDKNTRVVWICNPNNPTGEFVRESELITLHEPFQKPMV